MSAVGEPFSPRGVIGVIVNSTAYLRWRTFLYDSRPSDLILVILATMTILAGCSHQEVHVERSTVRPTNASKVADDRARLEEIGKLLSEYYRHPQPDRIPEVMQSLAILHRMAKIPDPYVTEAVRKNPLAQSTTSEDFLKSSAVGGIAATVGFLAEVFRNNPDRREVWIKTKVEGEKGHQSVLHALALAGLQRLAVTAMEEYGWSNESINRAIGPGGSISRIPPIWNCQPGAPADMDMFWGAFAASGKEQYVFKVLDIYKAVATHPDIRVPDIEFVAENMSKGTVSRESYARFQEYPEQQQLWLASAGTALWGMGSQAAQHERVRQILIDYIENSRKTEIEWTLARQIARSSKKILFAGQKEMGSIMVARQSRSAMRP